uniref:LMCD1 protein n=1 Tax=Gongylonema pulchrum TaxID=637853 RepID=A0A183DFT5_9BILA
LLQIRRQRAFWRESGLPKVQEQALTRCYTSCRETDPLCVAACECIHLQWIMDVECKPGARSPALPNCQRWYAKCKGIWRPRADLTPFPYGVYYAPPVVRGIFYGYDPLGMHILI